MDGVKADLERAELMKLTGERKHFCPEFESCLCYEEEQS